MSASSARRLARGASWIAAGSVIVQVLAFVSSVVAARHLGPDSFGVVGMSLVIVTFIGTVTDLGLTPAIASGRMGDAGTLRAAHWTLTLVGLVGTVLTFAAAPFAARFFETESVANVMRAQSPLFIVTAFAVVPQALLQRRERYGALTALRLGTQALAVALVVVLLASGAGLWALVLPNVLAAAVAAPMSWWLLGEWPRLSSDMSGLRKFVRESMHLTGFTICNYFARNADNAIVGRLGGAHALGEYAFAYGFLTRPLQVLSHSLVPVLMPSFGSAADDPVRCSDRFVRVLIAALRIGAPVTVGGAITAHLFVPVLFGSRWSNAPPLVAILMLVGALQIVGPIFGAMATATGRSSFVLRWGVWTAIVSVAAFYAGARAGGALGVAIAYLLFNMSLVLVMYRVARWHFGLPLTGLVSGIARIGRDVGIMVCTVAIAERILAGASVNPAARLLLEIGTGAATYVASVRLLAPRDAETLLSLMPSRLRGMGARALRLPVPN